MAVSRVVFVRVSDGVAALNVTAELMKEIGRPRGDMWEVALWEDILTVEGRELMYACQVLPGDRRPEGAGRHSRPHREPARRGGPGG